ncbi:DUF2235 domain-containing protein [Celeribacter indicus]|uniref:T6SS Phospholipase effector Tle1-like catalytic domain-containing protein n=1 Tax=Celeribacter indicus TaxID=1208324 RepID=A0A0B5DZ29_9RHOB|nr:DUF2235 domain-containing protein [Celeribacter indicus]AJE45991.1 hypothetical protein P73_1276 [Celeribacter indicus]SDW65660.1 Uncharacterized alpha/beta hydrolase domain [Celeribacter indicus]
MAERNGIFGQLGLLFKFRQKVRTSGGHHTRGPLTHVIILDGTLSSLLPGYETNAGLAYKLCAEAAQGANMLVRYEAGIQWRGWQDTMAVIEGRGLNNLIQRIYGALASRYRPGDRIYLFGYSRGAYAVRSLSGFIDLVGLLRPEAATERNIRTAFRHYQVNPSSRAARAFAAAHCHDKVPIEFLGVWDTVAAVGLHMPVVWRYSSVFHEFHNFMPARNVKAVYHALAYHESRDAYLPVLFESNPDLPQQKLVQMWFPGTHGDVGGMLSGYSPERRLSNTTLVWMLDKAEAAGLPLPPDWRMRYLVDPHAPSIGQNRGWGKFFLLRHRRLVGTDPSEILHPALKA